MGFEFDWQSVGIGYGAGLLSGYAIYRSRNALRSVRNTLTSGADSAQSFATMGGDRRYTNELTKYAMRSHLFTDAVELNDILIEPRFIPDREVATAPDEDDVRRNPFESVPLIADHPYLHQPYNINTISVEELGYGERAVALLGLPGSGRTSALLTIALWSMGKVDFALPDDPVHERIENEEKELSRQDRDERAKARIAIEQRAQEQLRADLGIDVGEEIQSAFIPPFRQMAPIYVHLGNIRLGNRDWRGNVDPAEPLIRALQYQTGRITSKTVPRKIYRFLNQGVALVLLDGLDELPPIEQRQKTAWLHAFLDEYNQNFIIVTSSPTGFGSLQHAGFTPMHLRPWSYQDTKTYLQKLGSGWGDIIGKRRATIDEDLQEDMLDNLWGLNPIETTIKIRPQFVDEIPHVDDDDFASWTRSYLADKFEDADDALPMMSTAATLQLDNHFFTLNEWVEIEIAQATGIQPSRKAKQDTITQVADAFDDDLNDTFGDAQTDIQDSFEDDFDEVFGASSSSFDDSFDDDIDEAFSDAGSSIGQSFDDDLGNTFGDDSDYQGFVEFESADIEPTLATPFDFSEETTVDESNASEETPKDENKEARQIRRMVGTLLSSMLKTGLVERYQGNRYRFRQSHIAGYLASLTIINSHNEYLLQKAILPQWSTAIAYAGNEVEIDRAVEIKMSQKTDILHTNILAVAYWLRYADSGVTWRNKYLTYLGQMLVSPGQYFTNRERVAAALVTTRDRGAKNIFGKGSQNSNVDVKRLSVLGLGAFQDGELMDNLSYFLDDATDEVRVAAALAIGNIHTEDAYTLLTEELFNTQSENVQQVVAETLADNPQLGYEILWELLNSKEYKDRVRLRRAAVLGVKRMRTEWSLVEIYRTYLDDQQWYVKSAAQIAFTERQSRRNKGVQGYPQITTLPWLQEWSLGLDDETATEASGIELLNMAMREPSPVIRYLATSTSGQLAVYENLPTIYHLLNDQEDTIRDTAHRALVDLQMRIGKPLPIPG